jgi:hypothetical protein
MSFVYNEAKRLMMTGALNLGAGGHDIRAALVMTNTTADTEDDVNTFAGFTTLDEYDHGSYARVALGGEVVNEDAPNNRAEFDANDITFPALGAGTRQAQGMIIYRDTGGGAGSEVPIAFIDTGGFPFTGTGGDVIVTWNAEGIVQGTS